MDKQRELSDKTERAAPSEHGSPPATTTRRGFLGKGARKIAYAAPVIVALSASHVHAGSEFDSTCGEAGSPCTIDGDCCTSMCHWIMSSQVCCVDVGETCTDDGDCCSYWCNGGTCN